MFKRQEVKSRLERTWQTKLVQQVDQDCLSAGQDGGGAARDGWDHCGTGAELGTRLSAK